MKRTLITVTAGLLFCAPAFAVQASKPNTIFILADDLGWTDTATYGSSYYETPNFDKLASQRVKLTRYHSQPHSLVTVQWF